MANIVAQFTSSLRTGVAPLTVNFTNTSTGPYNTVRWDFGDGNQSSQINPSHQYTSDGVYQVTLTIYDEQNGSSSSNTSITVFADDDYSTSSTTQQALFTTKRFTSGQVAVRKTLVDGSIIETSSPLSASTGGFAQDPNRLFWNSKISSSTTALRLEPGYLNDITELEALFDAGYDIWCHVFAYSGSGSYSADTSVIGSQMWSYKFWDVDGAGPDYFLDRETLDWGGLTVAHAAFYFAVSAGTSGATFTDGSVNQSLTSAPAIDGLESPDYSGMYQPNTRASGTLKYINGDDAIGESKLFITPSYTGWNTVERYKPGSVRLVLPYIMWHTKTTGGVDLIDSTITYRDEVSNLEYGELYIEDEGTVVGRVFYEKKLIVIDDLELQAALNYLSNRNYTLTEPSVSTTSTVDGTGGLQSGVTYFITYSALDDPLDSWGDSDSFGTGNMDKLHCRKIQSLSPTVDGNKFRIQAPESTWYTTNSTDLTGFTASIIDVFIGSATTGLISDAEWHYISNVGTYEELNSGIEVAYPSGAKTVPDFGDLNISGNSYLAFGDDPMVLGYFSALSQSTIYKMATTCVARNNEFNATQNPTYDNDVNESVWISEVALYNENNELLMTGKLNTPIEKNDSKFVTIKLELDL